MSGNKWSVERTIKFLEIYEQYPCLWDVRLESYKSREERKEAYEKIAKAMALDDFGVLDVRSKIRTLRNSYTLELAKLLKLKRSNLSDETFRSRLAWFPVAERFFSKVARSQSTEMDARLLSENKNSTDSSHKIEQSTSQPPLKQEKSSANIPPLPQERSTTTIPPLKQERSSASIPPLAPERSAANIPPLPQEKSFATLQLPAQEKSCTTLPPPSVEKQSREARQEDNDTEYHSMSTKTSSLFTKDDFDIFGAFVASELRGLDNPNAVRTTKKKIQSAILEAYDVPPPNTPVQTIYEQKSPKATQSIHMKNSQMKAKYGDDDPVFSAIKSSIVAD